MTPVPLKVIDMPARGFRRSYPGDMWQVDDGWIIILPNLLSWATFPRSGDPVKPFPWTVTGTPPDITVSPGLRIGYEGNVWAGWIRDGMLVEASPPPSQPAR